MTNFALLGAAGFVAPRHMQAILRTGGDLVAALDPSDSVGVLDSYFPEADFFVEFERFDRHLDKLRRSQHAHAVDFVSICSPNYLHDAHIRFALRSGATAICEKPVVLNPWNLDGLKQMESDTGHVVNTILQLRLHPSIINLRRDIMTGADPGKHDVDLTYITARGRWYLRSWKGDVDKSGGIATNIGVHFFDMLHFVFGELQKNIVHTYSNKTAAGFLEYEKARVRWLLSVDDEHLPAAAKAQQQRTFRSIRVDGDEIEFSSGFADLHVHSYQEILAGRGFGLETNRTAIETVATIRNAKPVGLAGEYHPLLKRLS